MQCVDPKVLRQLGERLERHIRALLLIGIGFLVLTVRVLRPREAARAV